MGHDIIILNKNGKKKYGKKFIFWLNKTEKKQWLNKTENKKQFKNQNVRKYKS